MHIHCGAALPAPHSQWIHEFQRMVEDRFQEGLLLNPKTLQANGAHKLTDDQKSCAQGVGVSPAPQIGRDFPPLKELNPCGIP